MKIRRILVLLAVFLTAMLTVSCKKSNSADSSSGPTVTDIDGNVYHTVVVGTQTWMVENLKVKHYRNGDPITNGSGLDKLIADTVGMLFAYDNSAGNIGVTDGFTTGMPLQMGEMLLH